MAVLDEVLALLDDLEAHGAVDGDGVIASSRDRLTKPLTIAVAGRTNAGKSTLVNALIGSRVAATRATECTRVVTWYRFGANQSRTILRDGTSLPLYTGPRGELPDELGVEHDDVDHLEVWLSYAPLRDASIVDTPGLSGDDGLADHTERLLRSGAVDALIFVLGEAVHADESAVINDFRAAAAGCPVTALGVLSRADLFGGDGGDPWPLAVNTAAKHAAALATGLAGVVPLMGKIAETTETGGFDESQAGWLRSVAQLDAGDRAKALLWAKSFEKLICLPPDAHRILLDRLGMHGIRLTTTPADASTSAADLVDKLRALSGISTLRRRLEVLFVRPAAVRKAARALAALDPIVAGLPGPARARFEDRVQRLRDHPDMHVVAELESLAALYSGRSELGDGATTARALRLWEEATPAGRLCATTTLSREELATRALEASRWWRAFSNTAATAAQQQLADTAHTSAHQLYETLRGGA